MIILLIGPPGSGKGTQARLLAEKLSLHHLSTGKLFRSIKNDPEVAEILKKGDLLPDSLVFEKIKEYFNDKNITDDIIIDGTPRSLKQYQNLKNYFKDLGSNISHAIAIMISDEEAVKRLSARREDKNTGVIYNLITNPPGPLVKKEDLVQRADDLPESISERLKVQKVPEDLINALKEDKILMLVNGEQSIEGVHQEILNNLKNDQ